MKEFYMPDVVPLVDPSLIDSWPSPPYADVMYQFPSTVVQGKVIPRWSARLTHVEGLDLPLVLTEYGFSEGGDTDRLGQAAEHGTLWRVRGYSAGHHLADILVNFGASGEVFTFFKQTLPMVRHLHQYQDFVRANFATTKTDLQLANDFYYTWIRGVVLANYVIAHPGAILREEPASKALNEKRLKKGRDPIPDRVFVSLGPKVKYNKDGTLIPPTPAAPRCEHDRRGHYVTSKLGKVFWRRSSRVKGTKPYVDRPYLVTAVAGNA